MLERDFRCRGCDYPLKGLPSGRCPECGTEFDWNKRTTYRDADEPGTLAGQLRNRKWPIIRLMIVLVPGLVGVAGFWGGWINYEYFACCALFMIYPMWLVACTAAMLSVVSPMGGLGFAGSLLLGIALCLLLGAVTGGFYGLIIATPAGLLGGMVFKQLELNNLI